VRVLIKADVGEARMRAEVNREAQTMGNVASLAAVRTEPFPFRGAVHAFHGSGAQHRNLLASLLGYLQRRKGE